MFSIVVPYYYKYDTFFEECLNSVLNQTFSDFELIVVYHPDEYHILIKHDLSDNRIKLFECNAKDQSSKRNVGILNSNKQYLIFVDCDDLIDLSFLSISKDIIFKYHPDLIVYNMCRELKKLGYIGQQVFVEDKYKVGLIPFKEFCNYFPNDVTVHGNYDTCWGKIYKTDFIKNKIHFMEQICCAEDSLFVKEYCLKINNIFYLDYYAYYWRINTGSTMNNINSGFYYIEPYLLYLRKIVDKLPSIYQPDLNKYATKLFSLRVSKIHELYLSKEISTFKVYSHFKNNYSFIPSIKKMIKHYLFEDYFYRIVFSLIKKKMFIAVAILFLFTRPIFNRK